LSYRYLFNFHVSPSHLFTIRLHSLVISYNPA
jgi:hypothetical protein